MVLLLIDPLTSVVIGVVWLAAMTAWYIRQP